MVLVIDDEALIRESIQDILEISNIQTLNAANGQAGIELFKDRRSDIKTILLDISMPVLSGPETLEKIRELDPEIYVILSSGYPEKDARRHITNDYHVIFLQKPYAIDVLTAKVQEACRRS